MKKALLLIFVNCILLHSSILLAQNEVSAVESTSSTSPSAELRLPTVHLLPDNPLYFLKTLKEKVQMVFTRDTSNQANLLLDFAQKRLAEAVRVAEKGKGHISEKLFESFGQDIKAAQGKIAEVKDRGEKTYGLLVRLQETVIYQKEVIEELREVTELDSFLVEVDQELGEATESGRMSVGDGAKGPGIFDWLRGLFGKKEILSPIAR